MQPICNSSTNLLISLLDVSITAVLLALFPLAPAAVLVDVDQAVRLANTAIWLNGEVILLINVSWGILV